MSHQEPLAFGCVGLGGYAATAVKALLNEQDRTDLPSAARLVAAYDPDLPAHTACVDELRNRGVSIHDDLAALLADPRCHAVWLPVPIGLHKPFTEQALAAGKAVLCEKPAAGCIDDVLAMIEARDRFRLPVAIGFQSIYQPQIQQAKQRLLEGAIGEIGRATVIACWPRTERYYHRNTWAGRLKHNGRWVLDSPANNAMSHFINQALFLMGREMGESACPVGVEAELYRANPIENYDTCAMRLTLDSGGELLIYLTHACREVYGGIIEIDGCNGRMRCERGRPIEFTIGNRREHLGVDQPNLGLMIRSFSNWVQGRSQIVSTLEGGRAHALAISGASQSTPVRTIAAQYVHTTGQKEELRREISEIHELCVTCAREGWLFHESGLAPWSSPPGRLDLRGYHHFAGIPLTHAPAAS
jgi:predicted dehydrogenase